MPTRGLLVAVLTVLALVAGATASEPGPAAGGPEYQTRLAATDVADADSLIALARWCYSAGMGDAALAHARQALEVCPDDLRAKYLVYALRQPVSVESETHKPFALIPSEPFSIVLARGGVMAGMDSVRVDHAGAAVLHRQVAEAGATGRGGTYERASLPLADGDATEIAEAANRLGLTRLHRSYVLDGVADGDQWVLQMRQGGSAKTVYCSNALPEALKAFAAAVDAVLARRGLAQARWQPASDAQIRERNEEIGRGVGR